MWLFLCTICSKNYTVKTIEKQQDLCGIIIDTNQIVIMTITTEIEYIIQSNILSLLTTRQVLSENSKIVKMSEKT